MQNTSEGEDAENSELSFANRLLELLPWLAKANGKKVAIPVFVPCRYTLSRYPAYSIVLLGSPGTGKTTTLEAGLAKLSRLTEKLGIELRPMDDSSMDHLNRIRDDYFGGSIKEPTKVNLALNLEASLIAEPDKRIRLSVIDVPGEMVKAIISGKGADAELRLLLRHANTIVLLFDLWSDQTIYTQLTSAGSNHFDKQLKLATQLEELREKSQGYFSDQRQLLTQLIEMLHKECTDVELAAMTFVCLFPKIDMLVSEDGRAMPQLIFTPMMKELVGQKLLVPGRKRHDIDQPSQKPDHRVFYFPELESFAGLGVDPQSAFLTTDNDMEDTDVGGETRFAWQVRLCRTLSRRTKDVIGMLGHILPDHVPDAAKEVFQARVEEGVVKKIEVHFPKSYFLPVSALGRIPTSEENRNRVVPSPNAVFAEYAFLLPLLAAFDESYPDRGSNMK